MGSRYKVVMCAQIAKVDTGIEGSYAEREEWCEAMGWEASPDGGFVWDLEIEEVWEV